ncbi:hypothetical protein CLOM_g6260 [Closterium sp. NIES-68]|nr:hypothetical protein CLOM_g6260 [Closterium sp. NIES-68]GJP82095.1 hypothetical protein CLOP_g12313 [Closterium sp. NIES-67]
MPVQTRSSRRRSSPPRSPQPPCVPPQKPLAAAQLAIPLARRASPEANLRTPPSAPRESRLSIPSSTCSARSAPSSRRRGSARPLAPISDIEDLGGKVSRGVEGDMDGKEGGGLEGEEAEQVSSEEGRSDESDEGVREKGAARRRGLAAGGASRRTKAKRLKADAGKGTGRQPWKEALEMKYGFSDEEVVAARSALLEWYDANRRDLPWRAPAGSEVGGEGDEAVGGGRGEAEEGAEGEEGQEAAEGERRAYGVWVSEVMLQQTRVSTVAPYFHRWMARWPSLPRLAAASLEEVNAVWAGLGYYRRAKYLLQGAQHIQQRHGGRMPRTAEELLGVPGIGPYTAAAIASIAFNQAAAAVDGNVMRILARLRALPLPLHQAASSSLFALLASRLLHPSRPGDFNQALMDLGSLVCSPSSPSCSSCPLSPHCRALALQQQGADRGDGEDGGVDGRGVRVTDFPVRKAKAAPREEWVAVCVVERRGVASATAPSHASVASAGVSAENGRRSVSSRSSNQPSMEEPSQFLLVQRPPQGLLAGLWEFPALVLSTGPGRPAEPQRRQAVLRLLNQMLPNVTVEGSGQLSLDGRMLQEGKEEGEGSKWRVIEQRDVGQALHVFSHIHQHMLIERILIAEGAEASNCCRQEPITWECSLGDAVAKARTRGKQVTSHQDDGNESCSLPIHQHWCWRGEMEMTEVGLSSGVRKVWEMVRAHTPGEDI